MKRLLSILIVLSVFLSGMGLAATTSAPMDPALLARFKEAFGEDAFVVKPSAREEEEEEYVINRKAPENDIRYVQQMLFLLELVESVTGQYGSATLYGVALFQEQMNDRQSAGLEVTGEVDARTLELMEQMAAQTKQDINTIVNFTDAELEEIIRKKLKMESGDVTINDLRDIETLTIFEEDVLDLGTLQYMTGLKELYIYRSEISDISVLRHLTGLEVLELGETKVTDISALENLTRLRELQIYQCDVSDISALANLTGLQYLNLNSTSVSDISPLRNLTAMQELKLSNTKIQDLGALAGMTELRGLWINNTRAWYLFPLIGLTKLEDVYAKDVPGLDVLEYQSRMTAGIHT